jgi:tripartite-type tricarboxylate transporter receptor subunit TctC
MKITRTCGWLLVAGLALAAMTPVTAQEYPVKPVTLVIPSPVGGIFDAIGRIVGSKAGELLQQQVIVNPKPGGAGSIGAIYVKEATPDGYTLLLGFSQTHVMNRFLIANLSYDPIKDFKPIAMIASSTTMLIVPASSPAKTATDLVALSKTKPGGLSYGSPGNGTAGHVVAEMFRAGSGANIVKTPYNGMAQIIIDLLGERLDLAFTPYVAARANLEEGKFRALGVTSVKRIEQAPNIPTMVEAGYPDAILDTWFAVFAPAGTPDAIVAKLNARFNEALADANVRRQLAAQGLIPIGGTPDGVIQQIVTETKRLEKIVKDAGITPE